MFTVLQFLRAFETPQLPSTVQRHKHRRRTNIVVTTICLKKPIERSHLIEKSGYAVLEEHQRLENVFETGVYFDCLQTVDGEIQWLNAFRHQA
jgi:hypothetical protein